jgi:hypothetical protein
VAGPGEPAPFRARFPWLGSDLQTLRDTLRPLSLPPESGEPQLIALPGGDQLLALLDRPGGAGPIALVLVVHGLSGSACSPGPWRLAQALLAQGFAVLRLNLRGAGAGRPLARGSYAARCDPDLRPVLQRARQLAGPLPLLGVGLSLGGTVLLNGCLDPGAEGDRTRPLLDGLVTISSPLDLPASTAQIDRLRNHLYQRWLVRRLRAEVLADPGGLRPEQGRSLLGPERPRSIRRFDALITAPRWGHASLEAYYAAASPLLRLEALAAAGQPPPRPLPPALVLHAADDPWVPATAARRLVAGEPLVAGWALQVLITPGGGHNGFHAPGDGPGGCWSDRFTAHWLRQRACG